VINLIDGNLVQQYLSAVQARDIVKQLPECLQNQIEQFKQLVLQDIRAQCNMPDLTEQDIQKLVAMFEPEEKSIVKQILSSVFDYAISAIKKHYPSTTVATVLAALINHYLVK
jgi:hypothetical protein